jgi:hypothetical protein
MIPARETLRAAYDAVIKQIDSSRASQQLANTFYSKVADAIFDACYGAIDNSEAAKAGLKVPRTLKVVSAPMGAGKTTFTLAFITALVRLSESDRGAPRGCVFLVEQMTKADEMFRELSALLPGKVAVWSTDHDVNCNKPKKVLNPAARFHVDELEKHEVAIVTHAFYKGKRGAKARNVLGGNGNAVPRVLTIIDEQTDDVAVFDVTLSGAAQVLEAVQKDERSGEPVVPYVQALHRFMTKKLSGGGNLEKPSDDPSTWDAVASDLAWFTTTAARDYERDRKGDIEGLEAVFSFAKVPYDHSSIHHPLRKRHGTLRRLRPSARTVSWHGVAGRHGGHRRHYGTMPLAITNERVGNLRQLEHCLRALLHTTEAQEALSAREEPPCIRRVDESYYPRPHRAWTACACSRQEGAV